MEGDLVVVLVEKEEKVWTEEDDDEGRAEELILQSSRWKTEEGGARDLSEYLRVGGMREREGSEDCI